MVKRVLGIATIVMISSFFMSCDNVDETQVRSSKKNFATNVKSDDGKVLPAVKFNVPANATINATKVDQYVKASSALLILGTQWSEKIEQAPDQEKAGILKNYAEAREQVCIRIGLAGTAEYNWLDTVAVRAPENAEVLKAAGIQVP